MEEHDRRSRADLHRTRAELRPLERKGVDGSRKQRVRAENLRLGGTIGRVRWHSMHLGIVLRALTRLTSVAAPLRSRTGRGMPRHECILECG